ncbi:inclusion body family protein [Mucilaginibacter sp. HMF5004]|uniref:AidA/PixA family protein n=1 Tax=Mucilaginibacter rivuli TaxID=2857527 RepID=UPI001C5CDA47|nr:AidA/PixA family protein [Mucilaginibacter rivuli]MBW4891883.1 inclusion body family protein [Mucilaginibacter rivuli]
MSTINVLIAVDGASLASQVSDGSISEGSANSPTNLGSYGSSNVFISMIAPNSFVCNSTQGQSELQISANGGDTIEWAITTFDNNFDQTAYLYAGAFNPATAINTPLSFACGQAYAYLALGNPPSSSNPTKFINQVSTVSGTILQIGVTIQYTLSFVLVDNSNGNIIGHFMWDPFIVVN